MRRVYSLLNFLKCGLGKALVSLVADKRHDHAVKVEEEHDQMEAEFYERFLLL